MRGTRIIVVSALCLTAALNLGVTAQAEPVAVVVVPRFDPVLYAANGALGLMVPAAGGTVTRAGALAALERGKVRHALLGGVPTGKILVRPSTTPGARATFYVALPPPGQTPNHTRYPVAVVGCGFQGLLTSHATRVPGLISIADIAPAVMSLRKGSCDASPLGHEKVRDAPARLRALDTRVGRVHDARGWALVAVLVTTGVLALVNRRGAVLACAGAIVASLVLSAIGVDGFWPLILGVAGITVASAWPLPRRLLPLLVGAFLVALLVVLLIDTQVNSLAVLGARPDGGGRFYGVTNQMETLILAPVIAASAVFGFASLIPIAVLALVAVGWSKAGADGGGIVVYAAALAVLGLRLRGSPLTVRRLVLVAVGVVVLTLALVGLDAAFGGSSHVTHAVGTGPGTLLGDLGRRLHLSYLSVTSSAGKGAEFGVGVAVLVAIAAFLRMGPTVDAMLIGLVVSFFVNDTPVDIAFLGALGCWTLVRWESVDSRAMRRRPVVLYASALLLLAFAVAGCGSEGTVHALPATVVGTVQTSVSGKQVFSTQGCTACHTFTPAGSKATIGPDLDKLPQYAKQAKQPVAKFVQTSITDPNAYIQKGYPANVMPKTYKSLPADQLKALVDFLTKKKS